MKFKIHVPKPCHEDFGKMTPTEKGKFCKSCSKEVIDFTSLTNTEIADLILKNNNLCGRFREDQLNKEIHNYQISSLPKVAAGLALLSTLLSTNPLYSQSKKAQTEKIEIKNQFTINNDTLVQDIVLKGKVRDESGDLPGVNITLKGSKISAETDFDGNFSIKIPNKKRKSIILVFSYLGYKKQEIDVLKIKKPLDVTLKEDEELLGEVVVVGYAVVKKKTNIFKRIGNLFRKKENRK